MMNEKALCTARELAIGYGKTPLLSDICLGVQPGQILTLIGPNGAGKSTLLKTLAGQLAPMGGTVLLEGRNLADYTGTQRAQKLALMAPHSRRMELTTCFDFVSAGRYPYTGRLGILSAEDRQQVHRALELVGAAQLADRDFNRISDGQRQRILLARALCQQPEVILLDEPTAFLDVTSRIETMNLLHRLAVEEQKAILLSTHDIEQALILADRLWLLTREGGLECGVTEDLILHNRMDSLFPQNKNIRFDLMHGGYSPIVSGQKSVCLQADDEMLRHWAQNALNRNNCFCLSELSDDYPTVRITSPENILLTTSQGTYTCTSFDELLQNI